MLSWRIGMAVPGKTPKPVGGVGSADKVKMQRMLTEVAMRLLLGVHDVIELLSGFGIVYMCANCYG